MAEQQGDPQYQLEQKEPKGAKKKAPNEDTQYKLEETNSGIWAKLRRKKKGEPDPKLNVARQPRRDPEVGGFRTPAGAMRDLLGIPDEHPDDIQKLEVKENPTVELTTDEAYAEQVRAAQQRADSVRYQQILNNIRQEEEERAESQRNQDEQRIGSPRQTSHEAQVAARNGAANYSGMRPDAYYEGLVVNALDRVRHQRDHTRGVRQEMTLVPDNSTPTPVPRRVETTAGSGNPNYRIVQEPVVPERRVFPAEPPVNQTPQEQREANRAREYPAFVKRIVAHYAARPDDLEQTDKSTRYLTVLPLEAAAVRVADVYPPADLTTKLTEQAADAALKQKIETALRNDPPEKIFADYKLGMVFQDGPDSFIDRAIAAGPNRRRLVNPAKYAELARAMEIANFITKHDSALNTKVKSVIDTKFHESVVNCYDRVFAAGQANQTDTLINFYKYLETVEKTWGHRLKKVLPAKMRFLQARKNAADEVFKYGYIYGIPQNVSRDKILAAVSIAEAHELMMGKFIRDIYRSSAAAPVATP